MSRSKLAFIAGILLIGCGWACLAFSMFSLKGAISVLAVFTTISVLVEPLLGLTFSVASLPWGGFTVVIPELLTLTKAITMLTCFALAVRIAFGGLEFPVISSSLKWYVFSFVFSFCTSIISPAYNEFFFEYAQTPLLIAFFPFLFIIILRNYDQFRFLSIGGSVAAAGMALAILVLGMEFFIRSETASTMRLSAGTNENELGQILGICLAMCLIAAANTTSNWRKILAVAGLLILYAILLTQSRGTWVGILFATSISTFFVPGLSFKQRVTVMMGIVLISFAAICLVVFDIGGAGKLIEARFSETLHEGTTAASARRIDVVWPLWLKAFWEHPIIGIGLGGGHSILDRSAHNDALSLLGERGILGFSLYMVFQIVIIVETLKNPDVSYKLISIWILLFLLGSGMFTESLALKSYGLGIGLVEALNNLGRESNYQRS